MDFDFYRAEIFGKIEERRGAIAEAMATMSDKELAKKIKREKLKFRRVEH